MEREPVDAPGSLALIEALNADTRARYPVGAMHFFSLSVADTAPGTGAFLVAKLDGVWCGCGAVRRLDDGRAELKRMYVAPSHRRLGVGGRVMTALLNEATSLGCTEIVLETGAGQPEALGLYRSFGFVPIACWGEYVANEPESICMGLRRR